MPNPVINAGQFGSDLVFTENWFSEFDGSVPLFDDWQPDTMDDALHRKGNSGIDADGNPVVDSSVNGKRNSAWYTRNSETAYLDSGNLVMGGLWTSELDPTRVAYDQNGETVRWDQHRAYTSLLTTWARQYDASANGGAGGFITHPDSPNRTWGPGTCFEARVNFEQMRTQAFRLSFWLMPAYEHASDSYDGDPEDIEFDLFEYENTPGFENYLQIKGIGGGAGQTPNGGIDMTPFGIDLRVGWHTITLLWTDTAMVVLVDGIEVQRDEILIPTVPHYLLWSREINSGAKTSPQPGELQAQPPYIPEDTGIYAKNAWFHRERINIDKGLIDYTRVWDINPAGTDTGEDPDGETGDVIVDNTCPTCGQSIVQTCPTCGQILMDHARRLSYGELLMDVDPKALLHQPSVYHFSNGRVLKGV